MFRHTQQHERGFSPCPTGEGPEKRLWSNEREFYSPLLTTCFSVSWLHQPSTFWGLYLAYHFVCLFSVWPRQLPGFPATKGEPCTAYLEIGELSESDWLQLGSFLGKVTARQDQSPSSASSKPNRCTSTLLSCNFEIPKLRKPKDFLV